MEGQPSQYEPGQIPEEARKEALKKAPVTLTGLGVGGVLGALIAGRVGALVGGIIGGILGYTHDTKQQRQ